MAPSSNTTGNPETTPTISPSSPAVRDPTVNPDAAGTVPPRPRSNACKAVGARAGDNTLKAGANSFTEEQARRRIADCGYTHIGRLHKDENSIWQTEATKDGGRARVGLDYRGNVVEEK
jgi:hypothetical protein